MEQGKGGQGIAGWHRARARRRATVNRRVVEAGRATTKRSTDRPEDDRQEKAAAAYTTRTDIHYHFTIMRYTHDDRFYGTRTTYNTRIYLVVQTDYLISSLTLLWAHIRFAYHSSHIELSGSLLQYMNKMHLICRSYTHIHRFQVTLISHARLLCQTRNVTIRRTTSIQQALRLL